MDNIQLRSISKIYDVGKEPVLAIESLDLDIEAGSIYCLLGPSGCGKSTVLNMIAGFEQPSGGTMLLAGKNIGPPGPDRAVVFQHPTLYPWLSVFKNISLGLDISGEEKAVIEEKVMDYIGAMGLTGFAGRYPYELSGGMQQRVAIARAWINQPKILLLDEPFGALDAQTKIKMQELLLDIWGKFNTTILFITHDVEEAIFLGDKIGVMTGRPSSLHSEFTVKIERPRTLAQTVLPEFIGLKKSIYELLSMH